MEKKHLIFSLILSFILGFAVMPVYAQQTQKVSGILGVEPFNGKRRDNIELCAKATATEASNSDPILANRPAPLDLKNDLSAQFSNLSNFYDSYLIRKTRIGDELNKVVTFLPKYYFIGLTNGAQTNNITLKQTIGWGDATQGNANGTFDPLAE